MKYFFFLCFIEAFFLPPASAQQVLRVDSTLPVLRAFSPGALNEYKDDPAFTYERTVEPARSLWSKFWSYIWQQIEVLMSTENGRRAVTIAIILISAAILAYFILRLTGMPIGGLFGKKNTAASTLPYSVESNDIHGIAFDEVIGEAVRRRDFRGAVRLLYLQSLKLLSDAGLIQWKIDKTNIAYLHELTDSTQRETFRVLTIQFENCWYGDRRVEEAEFMDLWNLFKQFNTKLKAL